MLNSSKQKILNPQKLIIQTRKELNNWQNIAVCDNYLMIKDNNIQIFEIDLSSNSANYRYDIRAKEELLKIISIDKNNIFFFFSASIVKFDIMTKMVHPVQFFKLINDDKLYVNSNDITSIYFNEKIKLSFDEKNFYFGLMGLGEEGEFLISKEVVEDKDSGHIEVVCEPVRKFYREIKHVELKVFYPNEKEVSKGNLFITVLTNAMGWYTIIKLPELNDYNWLVEEIKKTEWLVLYDINNFLVNNIFYSFYYDTNYGLPISFILLTDSLKMKYCNFSDYNNGKIYLESENEINFEQEIKISGIENRGIKMDNLVGTHHYDDTVYVAFKNRIFLYDLINGEMITCKKYESEYIRDIYIHDPSNHQERKPYYHLYFLSNRNIYYSKIETNYQMDKYRSNTHNFNMNDSMEYDVEERKCAYCKKASNKRCSACKSVFYCSEYHQELDWNNHRRFCPWKAEESVEEVVETKIKLDIDECIVYSFQWEKERNDILNYYKERDRNNKSFTRGIDLCYSMIQKNREKLSKLNGNVIKAIKTISNTGKEKDRELLYKNSVNLYKLYEDYVCNIFLLIYGFLLKKNKSEAWRLLNKLIKEIEEKEIQKYIDLFTEYIKTNLDKNIETPKTTRNFEREEKIEKSTISLQEIQELFLRYLQILTTIAKIYYSIGEFSSYENYIIHYIERLEKVYQGNTFHGVYIIANAYLLMANLYVELDNLGKAIVLYNECLNLIPDPKENKDVADLAISVNYNLGVVYFITDQYLNCKSKLDQALKIKKDYKLEDYTEQTAIIYETIGEIEIEYKNFTEAFKNLQNAIDIRSKLPNINDKKSKMKINILLDYIYQNLEKENDKKFNRKGSFNNMTMPNTYTKDERDFDDLMNYIRSTNDDKNDNKKDKARKAKYDVDLEELEKFFLFMTKLSSLQIQVLNSTQPDVDKNLKMPIFFSADFKNCLNHHQRLEVCNLKVMSLRRNKILKNPRGKIEVENLNYDALHAKNSQNNLSSIKNYFVVNKIMRNWEVTKKYANTSHLGDDNRTTRILRRSTLISTQKMKNTPIQNNLLISQEEKDINDEKTSHKISDEIQIQPPKEKNKIIKLDVNQDNDKINFDHFQSTIRSYCKEHMPLKEHLLEDKILLFLSQKLSNEELQTLMENPEFVFEIIEEYNDPDNNSEMNKENESEDEYTDKIEEESSKEEEENQSYGSEGSEGGKKDDDKKSKIPKVPGLNAMTKIDI